jgi:hypothetical protein
VHRGGTAAILADALLNAPDRHLHLFDRWGDLPEPTDEDGFRKEQYKRANNMHKIATLENTLQSAKHAIESVIGFPSNRVTYYQGWFDETIKRYPGTPIAFASIDTDYFASTKPVLALCGRHAARHATFFIDDYAAWPGARRAVDEFLACTERKIRLSLTPMGRAIMHFLD